MCNDSHVCFEKSEIISGQACVASSVGVSREMNVRIFYNGCIIFPKKDRWLSWPRWLITYRDGLPTHRQSAIQVVTGPGIE